MKEKQRKEGLSVKVKSMSRNRLEEWVMNRCNRRLARGLLCLGFSAWFTAACADVSLVTAPTIQANKKTYTMITVGDAATPVKVTLDTGSSMLVLEKQYVTNFRSDLANNTITMEYGNGAMVLKGRVVYTNVTLNTSPAITATDVPILMVPDGTFKDRGGIMGVEMNSQTSVWRHLPLPYNEMMIVSGPDSSVSFGALNNEEINAFATVQLNEAACANAIQPEPAYATVTCWATRKIPLTYTFKSPDNQVVYQAQYNTLFDTGGVLTHFFLQPIPDEISELTKDQHFNGVITMSLSTNNAGAIELPATQQVGMIASKRNFVNSGFDVFRQMAVLFDARDGVVGFK